MADKLIHSEIQHKHLQVDATFQVRKDNKIANGTIKTVTKFTDVQRTPFNLDVFGFTVVSFQLECELYECNFYLTKDKNSKETVTGYAGLYYVHNSNQQNQFLNERKTNVQLQLPSKPSNKQHVLPVAQKLSIQKLMGAYEQFATQNSIIITNNENNRIALNQHYCNLQNMIQNEQFSIEQWSDAHSFYSNVSKTPSNNATNSNNFELVSKPLIPPLPKQWTANTIINDIMENNENNNNNTTTKSNQSDNNIPKNEKNPRNPKKHQCSKCNKTFTFRQALNTHIREVHDWNMGDIDCKEETCSKKFDSGEAMDRHYKHTHLKKQEFDPIKLCTKCNVGHLGYNTKKTRVWCLNKHCNFNQKYKGDENNYVYTGSRKQKKRSN